MTCDTAVAVGIRQSFGPLAVSGALVGRIKILIFFNFLFSKKEKHTTSTDTDDVKYLFFITVFSSL